ncbi:MAG: hypothetical protein E2O54_02150, partial [Gammaproteobacteria bacterium]
MNARLPICARSGRIDLRLTPETNGLGGMMIKTQGLTHIHLVVRDLDRALNFYTNVFG